MFWACDSNKVERMSIRKERCGSIQCHPMLGHYATARVQAAVDFNKFFSVTPCHGDGFLAGILANISPYTARDAVLRWERM